MDIYNEEFDDDEDDELEIMNRKCPKCKYNTEHPQKHCIPCSFCDMFEKKEG